MTQRISCRRHVAGALAIAALLVNAPPATAQAPEQRSKLRAGMDRAMQAVDKSPRLKSMSQQGKQGLVEFAIGNTLFVLAHEMGHAVINELDLPVLGREEDAADAYAIVTALQMKSQVSERVLLEATKGWFLSSKRDKKEGNELAFYDEHGLDLQRAYNVVCLMVGSDPEKYKALAAYAKLPDERQTSCVRDYSNATWSWEKALKPHLRSPDQPKVTIKIDYQDDKEYAVYADVLRHMSLLESLAAHAADRYVWRSPITMEARACGDANATWTINKRTLTLCYELVQEFAELFAEYSKELQPRPKKPAR